MGCCSKKIRGPLVSVIMSVYNGEVYLPQSIESILKQSLSDFEFIIINDGSTDNTGKIINRYSKVDSRIIPIHQKNIGLTKSLNLGIRMARGKFIARQDADDISHNERLKKQIEFLLKNKEYKLIGTSCFIINENGEEIGKKRFRTEWEEIRANAIKENQFVHSSVMMEREALLSVGVYDEEIKYGQDYELWLRFLDSYKGVNIPEYLIRKRICMESIGQKHRRERMLCAGKAALRNLLSRKEKKLLDAFYVFFFFLQYLIPDYMWYLLRNAKGNRSLAYKSFKK